MVKYPVPDIRCMFCRYRLQRAIQKIDPCLKVKIDVRKRNVVLTSHDDIHTVERAQAYLKGLARLAGSAI